MDTIQPTIPAQSSASSWRWWVLAIVGIAELMIVLDATIVNIALPSAQHALGFANSDREWIVTAYALAFGSFLLPGGRLGDIFGRKWTFIGSPGRQPDGRSCAGNSSCRGAAARSTPAIPRG